MKDKFWLWEESTIPFQVCENWIRKFDQDLYDAQVGMEPEEGRLDTSIRKTSVKFVNDNDVTNRLMSSALHANRMAFDVDIVSYYTECQFAKYEDKNNDFYDWHIDSGVNVLNGMYDRKITVIALLSDPNTFSGGELFIGDDKTKVNLQYGSIVAFPSFLLHRVTPVTKGTRYSMVLWAHGPSWR